MLTKRQRDILEFIKSFVEKNAYAPSLEEIAERFSLHSVATVHKHISNLIDRGMLRRGTGSRSIEVLSQPVKGAGEIALLGRVAAGRPIEAVSHNATLSIPPSMMKSRKRLFALLHVLLKFVPGPALAWVKERAPFVCSCCGALMVIVKTRIRSAFTGVMPVPIVTQGVH